MWPIPEKSTIHSRGSANGVSADQGGQQQTARMQLAHHYIDGQWLLCLQTKRGDCTGQSIVS